MIEATSGGVECFNRAMMPDGSPSRVSGSKLKEDIEYIQ
jgi:hypothetical protein